MSGEHTKRNSDGSFDWNILKFDHLLFQLIFSALLIDVACATTMWFTNILSIKYSMIPYHYRKVCQKCSRTDVTNDTFWMNFLDQTINQDVWQKGPVTFASSSVRETMAWASKRFWLEDNITLAQPHYFKFFPTSRLSIRGHVFKKWTTWWLSTGEAHWRIPTGVHDGRGGSSVMTLQRKICSASFGFKMWHRSWEFSDTHQEL